MPTISFHTDKTTSIAHNNRVNVYGNKNINIDKIKDNITYVKRDIEEVYAEQFDVAVSEYNAKQKRSDRKIDNYYKKVLHDKKTEHQRELIVAIGDSTENLDESIVDLKKEILDKYARDFQERNPNLRVYNCVLHLDEKNPHLHINYVPVASYTRGLKKRVAFEKALEQQGYTFEKWQEHETGCISSLMALKGLKRDFKGSHEHMKVKEYKEFAEELSDVKEKLQRIREQYEIAVETVKKNSLNLGQIQDIRNYRVKQSTVGLFGKEEKGVIKMFKSDFEMLYDSAEKAYLQHNLYATVSEQLENQEKLIEQYREDVKSVHRLLESERREHYSKEYELKETIERKNKFISDIADYLNRIDKIDECNEFLEKKRKAKTYQYNYQRNDELER